MKTPTSIQTDPGTIAPLKRWSRITSGVGLVALIAIGLIAAWSLRQIDTTDYWVSHTYQVISTAQKLLFDLKESQAATRAFILHPDSQHEIELQQSLPPVQDDVSTLQTLTADNHAQQDRLKRIEPLIANRDRRLQNIVAPAGSGR